MSGTHDLPRPKMWRRKGIAGFGGGIVVSEDGGSSWKPVQRRHRRICRDAFIA